MGDLGEGLPPPLTLFWVKKTLTEGRKAGRQPKQNRPPTIPALLLQFKVWIRHWPLDEIMDLTVFG